MPVPKKYYAGVTQMTAVNLNRTGFTNLAVREQDTPDMTLAVLGGMAMIDGVAVSYAGGNTGTFTAPSTNPRIDLVTLTAAGTLAVITGTEAGSPVAPTYPLDSLVLCEVYLRTGSTYIYQDDAGSHSYIKTDSRYITVGNNRFENVFSTGADGDVSINSGTTTLAADMYYNNLTIAAGATLVTAGYKVFVKNKLTNAGTIHNDGSVGGTGNSGTVGGIGGAGGAGATFTAGTTGSDGGGGQTYSAGARCGSGGGGGGTGGVVCIIAREIINTGTIRSHGGAGGAGGVGVGTGGAANVAATAGTNGSNKTCLGSNGAAGGLGNNGQTSPPAAGTAGTATGETVKAYSGFRQSANLTAGSSNNFYCVPELLLYASTNSYSLSTSAGSGGGGGSPHAGTGNAGGGGGGGGGSGGVVILCYQNITLGTVTVTGGNGGAGGACQTPTTYNGIAGSNGNAGKIYKLILV